MNGNNLAFDRATQRWTDDNGFLHVDSSHITKATVNPYYGREIPGWKQLGLDPEKIYYGLREAGELEKSARLWNGLPLHMEHHVDSADNPEKWTRVGAVGESEWQAPYVNARLTIWDKDAIEAVKDGSFRELSCSYRYDPDFTPGTYEGVAYDFVMRNIRGNHVALVEEGRAGPDVLVADANPDAAKNNSGGIMNKFKRWFRGANDASPEVEKEEVDLAQAIIDLRKVDPNTGEIVDIAEDEDKAEEIMGKSRMNQKSSQPKPLAMIATRASAMPNCRFKRRSSNAFISRRISWISSFIASSFIRCVIGGKGVVQGFDKLFEVRKDCHKKS